MKKISGLFFFGILIISFAYGQAPITITPGRPHNATLQGTTEQRYSVSVPDGSRLIAYTESKLDTVMRIYNAQGEEIAFDDDSGTDYNARISIVVPAGTYTIGVRGYSEGHTGPYTLHVLTEAVVITNITAGRAHRAALQRTTEQLYNVRVPAGRLLAYTESDLDTVMRIYNERGEEIAYDDDSGDGLNARISIVVPAGTYTIGVRGFGSGDEGPYTLHAISEPITTISAGRPHRATLQGTAEQLYNVRVPAGRRLIAYTESGLDTVMRIYNDQGEEIAYNDDSGTDYNARINIRVPEGTYTIEVRGFSEGHTGPYTLHVLTEAVVITSISAGSVHNATLQGTTEQLYNVRVPAGRLIVYTESELDTVMHIYNSQGELVDYDDDSGTDYNARVDINVPAGTYNIEVRGYSENYTGPYTLHVLTR